MAELQVVTGAFGYSGKYIAARLLAKGHRVRTLTNSAGRANPFGGRVEARPFDFDDRPRLVESLRGAAALYNTYWVRFNHGEFRFSLAVENTLALFEAAHRAGVGRVVHVSITNPSEGSPFEYFRAKARLERALQESGIPHLILRPAVLFGHEDILINNLAWVLRRFPVFAMFGDGRYRLQPLHVEDLAALAVESSADRTSRTIDAVGPEIFSFRDLARQIGAIIGRPRPLVSVPPLIGYALGRFIGAAMGDVLLTRDEIGGLMAGLLCTHSPAAGETRLTEWARAHAPTLGRRYASELARRRNRRVEYEGL